MGTFSPSIRETTASGFLAPINSQVNQLMYNSVADAYYKLIKYYNLKEWESFLKNKNI